MKLARVKNVEKYILFTKERILLIDSTLKGISKKDDPDPIGSFLYRQGIKYDETPFEEFKNTVDTEIQ